ncbi:MAG: SprB repeat-containing protein, partial [Saprospiraceae bacterium]|nr:SprB repeat-containing protein [Saprospiraceae bacterium]
GCISGAIATVGVVGQLELGITISPISCHDSADGTATVQPLNATAPYAWLWADGQTSSQITGLGSGSYTVTVTDANGCSKDLNFSIAAPAALSLSISATDVNCFEEMDGTASVVASGGTPGYEYFWSNMQTSATATQLSPDWQTVTVTDENGCSDTTGILISQPPMLFVTAMPENEVLCPGQTTSILANSQGGVPPYAYLWSDGSTGNPLTGAEVTPGTNAIFIVTVTDANGCSATNALSLSGQPTYSIEMDTVLAASNPTASDGGILVSIVGGISPFAYSWSNGTSAQDLANVLPGNYTLTVTDGEGCDQTATFTVDFLMPLRKMQALPGRPIWSQTQWSAVVRPIWSLSRLHRIYWVCAYWMSLVNWCRKCN